MTEHSLEVLKAVRVAAAEAQCAGELPAFLGALETVRVEVLLSMMPGPERKPAGQGDQLLTARETAERIGMSVWWIRKNRDSLPLVRLPTGRYGFSEKGLERWLQRRST